MMPKNKSRFSSLKIRSLGLKLLFWLPSRWLRVLIITLALVALGYGLYSRAWVVFQGEPELPAGVTPTNPSLDTTLLREINAQRTERSGTTLRPFDRESKFFVPLPPAR
jgi:hypothetical protein